MQPNEDEIEALWDMKKAIEEIQSFMVGFSEEILLKNFRQFYTMIRTDRLCQYV